MHLPEHSAPGGSGSPARWTSSAKTGVGTALSNKSNVWFTLSHGIFNEIYYPRIDQACIRDMGLIVTDGAAFFSEEKRDCDSKIHALADDVPAFRLVNTCRESRYRIEKRIVSDPHRDAVLQHVEFIAQQGDSFRYHLYVLLAPHLGNHGGGNTAWVDDFEGQSILFTQRESSSLALACSEAWLKRSVGYVGSSDGWQDLKAHKQITAEYTRAENGNVSLVGEIDLRRSEGKFVLALGFGRDPGEAARNATASLHGGFEKAQREYVAGWQESLDSHSSVHTNGTGAHDLSRTSLAVLRTHESKTAPGAFIASLSIPWGFSKGDADLAVYHLVWPRDMVETAGGLLAAGSHDAARRALSFPSCRTLSSRTDTGRRICG
jgi:glucoamylase